MPKRVQMTRQRPWRKDHPDAVIVARPSKWGNPYRITRRPGSILIDIRCDTPGLPSDCTASEELAVAVAVGLFEETMRHSLAGPLGSDLRRKLDQELRGRDLACWCPLDQECHADVLLEIANAPETEGDRDGR